MPETKLAWQSKTVLLAVLPFVAAHLVLETHWWFVNFTPLAVWSLGLSLLLGLIALQTRSATFAGAATGAAINASLMFSTAVVPYQPWRTALVPVLAVLVLTSMATRFGRARKERLGLAEQRRGRAAAQVAANLGIAAIVASEVSQSWMVDRGIAPAVGTRYVLVFAPMLAALAEAAADTVSSEIGQALGGTPRMITTWRRAEAGANGAVSVAGTLASAIAAAIVAAVGSLALRGGLEFTLIALAGGVFGLFFDSVLGATLERRGWLNNDLVNFLSTASAAAFALLILALMPHHGIG